MSKVMKFAPVKRREQDQEEVMRKRGYITLTEAALRLGVHYMAIYRAAKKGKIELVEVGERKYVGWKSFAEYAGPMAGELNKVPKVVE